MSLGKVPMYSTLDRKDRIRIRIALSLAWAVVALGALGGILLTPLSLRDEIVLLNISSSITLVFSTLSLIGVATNRFWIEWWASWLGATGLVVYVVSVWNLVFTTTPTRLQQASYLTALIFFMIYRGLANGAHARKNRDIMKHLEELKAANNDG